MMFPHSDRSLASRLLKRMIEIRLKRVGIYLSGVSRQTTILRAPIPTAIIRVKTPETDKLIGPKSKPKKITRETRLVDQIDAAYAPMDPQSRVILCGICGNPLKFRKTTGKLSTIYHANCTSNFCHFMLFETGG